MTARRSVLAHPAILYAATVAAAVLAALGQQAIAQRWGDGWDWVDFGKAVFANGVIAILLAIVARALQREQDRVEAVRVAAEQRAIEEAEAARQESAERGRLLGQAALPLAISGWSKVPLEPGTIATEETLTPELLDNLADNAKQWRDLAEELNGLVTSRPASGADQQEQYEAGKIAFLRLSGLSNSMQLYLMEGGRRRRLIYLQWLANDYRPPHQQAGTGRLRYTDSATRP